MTYHTGPKIVTEGLVLNLDAGNPKSYPGDGTSWVDLSVEGNDGDINGATYTSNGAASNFLFNGLTNNIDCGNDVSLVPSSAMTIEAWLYLTSKTGYNSFCTRWDSTLSNASYFFTFFTGTSRLELYLRNVVNSTNTKEITDDQLSLNTWH